MEKVDTQWVRKRVIDPATGKPRRGVQARLADYLGLSKQKVNKLVTGERKPQAEEVDELREFFRIDGETEAALPFAVDEGASDEGDERALIEVFDVQAAAGCGAIVPDYEPVIERMSLPRDYLRRITATSPRHLAIISVIGKSMVPTLMPDDVVMVDTTKRNPAFDGMFVIRHDDVLKVKRLRWGADKTTVRLISDNDREYPEEVVSAENVEIVGRVVWSGRREP